MRNIKLIAILITTACLLWSFTNHEKRQINLVFIGDSITHGARLKDFVTQAPPVFASDYLKQTNRYKSVQYSNQGVSGFTTVDFLPQTHKAFTKVLAASTALQASGNEGTLLVFSIMLGTNDSAIKGPNGAPLTPESYINNLKTIADTLLATYPHSIIVINHPIWYSPNTDNGHSSYMQEGLDRLQLYSLQIDRLVKSYNKTQHGRVYLGDTSAFEYFEKNYTTDLDAEHGPNGTFYLHPNAKGAHALGLFWGKALEKVLKN
jgi:lysophospholipase L1-like esterase